MVGCPQLIKRKEFKAMEETPNAEQVEETTASEETETTETTTPAEAGQGGEVQAPAPEGE